MCVISELCTLCWSLHSIMVVLLTQDYNFIDDQSIGIVDTCTQFHMTPIKDVPV